MAISTYASHTPMTAPPRDTSPAPATANTTPPAPTAPAAPVVQRHAIQAATASAPNNAKTSWKTTVDSSTGDLVYQVIDNHSGQKIDQSPEEAMLRIRAYARQIDASKQADAVAPKANAKS